jgi:hypothetical protein
MLRIFILTSVVFFSFENVFSQSNCAQILKKAQTTFDQGRIDEIPTLLEPCLKEGFNKEETIAAYKLLTLTYLYQNEQAQAESYMIDFLRLNPEYKINPVIDPNEFINLYNSMRTRPVFLFGIMGGGNVSHINAVRNFSIENTGEIRGAYLTRLGYQAGIAMEILLGKTLSFCPEIYVASKKYEFSDSLLGFSHMTYKESNVSIDLPLLLRKNFIASQKVVPFIEAGFTGHGLLSASSSLRRVDVVNGLSKDIEGNVDMMNQRHRLNYSFSLGAGLKLKDIIGSGNLTFSLRYNLGMLNQVNALNRYDNENMIFGYLYIENDYKLNYMTFSLGYLIPHYKPKKITSKQ